MTTPLHIMRVHYDPITGEIKMWEFTNDPQKLPNAEYIDGDFSPISMLSYKVDLTSKTIVEMSDAEKKTANAPHIAEVASAIARELAETDKTQAPDFPISDAKRNEWKNYRKSLRDLSKQYQNGADMLRNWPNHPENQDPAKRLKDRL